MKFLFASATALVFASPVMAQMDMNMPGMKMPARAMQKAVSTPKPKIVKQLATKRVSKRVVTARRKPTPHKMLLSSSDADTGMSDMSRMAIPAPVTPSPTAPNSDHDMSAMPGMDMGKPITPTATPTAGASMPGMSEMPSATLSDTEIGNAPAPAPPTDHAADTIFGADQMAGSRTKLRHENGGVPAYSALFNLAEYRAQKGGGAYRWDGEGWFGGDINRLVVKSEGEGAFRQGVSSAEVQALYSRAVSPYFNLQAGVRQDIKPQPARSYATIGFEGIAPYWFEVAGAVFLSDKGDLLGRLEGYYDQRITQRLILQPRVELNFAAQNIPADGVGAGLSDAELGLRLRYEIKHEFAPYVGVSWDGKAGDTARYARAAGERVQGASLVLGIRAWF